MGLYSYKECIMPYFYLRVSKLKIDTGHIYVSKDMYKSSFELQRFILPSKKWQPNLACAKKAFYLKLTPGTISLYKIKVKRRKNKQKQNGNTCI